MAETKGDAETALDAFIEGYAVKYDKAAECLSKDRGALLAFHGCLSNRTALAMVFKLVEGARKTWRRLDGHAQLPELILGGEVH
jgi:hypothetical protein